MSFRIVRNDITRMETEAIVNTANPEPEIGAGCDLAVYRAAGEEALLRFRREKIGRAREGEVFLSPGFQLKARYIIHAVSPRFEGGRETEEKEQLLRGCYRKSLKLALEHGIRSVAFPLISTGSYGCPKELGMRIAVDELRAFSQAQEMEIILVVFDDRSVSLGQKITPDLDSYIDRNYVRQQSIKEYGPPQEARPGHRRQGEDRVRTAQRAPGMIPDERSKEASFEEEFDVLKLEKHLSERLSHRADSFSDYMQYLIQKKGLENADVYKRAIVDRKVFSKIKNNADYHPNKRTALCLCVGAMLNLDESRDLLSRAGYALSPCDRTDIIFSYFIENQIYDMIELDIQLEEHGLPCIIQ